MWDSLVSTLGPQRPLRGRNEACEPSGWNIAVHAVRLRSSLKKLTVAATHTTSWKPRRPPLPNFSFLQMPPEPFVREYPRGPFCHVIISPRMILAETVSYVLLSRRFFPDLNHVPSGLPSDIVKMDLSGNNIGHLKPQQFLMSKDLKLLNLSSNSLQHIETGQNIGYIWIKSGSLRCSLWYVSERKINILNWPSVITPKWYPAWWLPDWKGNPFNILHSVVDVAIPLARVQAIPRQIWELQDKFWHMVPIRVTLSNHPTIWHMGFKTNNRGRQRLWEWG